MDDWFNANGSGSSVDVVSLLDSEAGKLLHEVCGSGALISIGLTRDSGALGVTVTVDGRWRRDYFRNGEDLADWLRDGLGGIRAAVEAARTPGPGSGARRKVRTL